MHLEQVGRGRARETNDECRRYRVVDMTFDTRSHWLTEAISEDWDPVVQQQHREGARRVREGLLQGYGVAGYQVKIQNFIDLGAEPFSVIAAHNFLLHQVRGAFVLGAYYPALLGAGGLGERILNELILRLRDDYADQPSTKRVSGKSFNNWQVATKVLESWGVFDSELTRDYLRLARLRHDAVHYQPGSSSEDWRDGALAAIRLLQSIIERRFAAVGGPPTYLGTPGEIVLARESESEPFVKHFIIPSCALVSPRHRLDAEPMGGWVVLDDVEYPAGSLTDEQWADARATGIPEVHQATLSQNPHA